MFGHLFCFKESEYMYMIYVSGCSEHQLHRSLIIKRIKELINTLNKEVTLKDQNDSKHGIYNERPFKKLADFFCQALFLLHIFTFTFDLH